MRKTQVEFTFVQRGWVQLPIPQLLELLPKLDLEIGQVKKFKHTTSGTSLIILAEVEPARASSVKSTGSTFLCQAIRQAGLSENVTIIAQINYGRNARYMRRSRTRQAA